MKKTLGYFFAIYMVSAGTAAWGKIGGGDITFKIAGAKNVTYSHELHIAKAATKCSDCHYRLHGKAVNRYTMADMANGKSCGACHNGQQAFSVKENCEKCHT